jgi:hypothetical protein
MEDENEDEDEGEEEVTDEEDDDAESDKMDVIEIRRKPGGCGLRYEVSGNPQCLSKMCFGS